MKSQTRTWWHCASNSLKSPFEAFWKLFPMPLGIKEWKIFRGVTIIVFFGEVVWIFLHLSRVNGCSFRPDLFTHPSLHRLYTAIHRKMLLTHCHTHKSAADTPSFTHCVKGGLCLARQFLGRVKSRIHQKLSPNWNDLLASPQLVLIYLDSWSHIKSVAWLRSICKQRKWKRLKSENLKGHIFINIHDLDEVGQGQWGTSYCCNQVGRVGCLGDQDKKAVSMPDIREGSRNWLHQDGFQIMLLLIQN